MAANLIEMFSPDAGAIDRVSQQARGRTWIAGNTGRSIASLAVDEPVQDRMVLDLSVRGPSTQLRNPGRVHRGQTSMMWLGEPGVQLQVIDAMPLLAVGDLSSFAYMTPVMGSLTRTNEHHDAMLQRIALLREEAVDEGDTFNERSAELLLAFCDDLAADYKPAIVLMQNGNLRTVWQNPTRDQIGIQFFTDGRLQYVILRDRDGTTHDTSGHEPAEEIKRIVHSLGLSSLWFHG